MSDADVIQHNQDLDRAIMAEQVALMCRLMTLPLFGSIFVGAIVAYVASADAGWATSAVWYAASLIILVVRWRVAHAYLDRYRKGVDVQRWRTTMLALIGLYGAIWSIPPGFLLPTDPVKEIIMSVLFIGVTATGMGSLAPVRHAYAMLLIPFVVPYGVNQFLMGGDRMLIGFACLVYLPIMIAIASRQTSSVASQIRLAIENEALADALRVERDRVTESNRELQQQVEQHRQAAERIRQLNRDLELQAVELRTANGDLEGFSYSVSHDLRAPLRAIDGFSQLLKDQSRAANTAESDHYVRRIRENIVRMSTLIDDLLAFSRCGRQSVEMIDLRMEDLVRVAVNEALATYSPRTPPDIVIRSLPSARGDKNLVQQVWLNLIDNAVKYSGKMAQPRIVVDGREEANRVIYEVTDNGIGFDPRYSGSLFGAFQRLHGGQDYPGTGVGLAIVQRIVVRHGGKVWARSEVDQGATFGFALPRSAAHSVATAESNAGNG